jgi:hypothetical protein
VKAVPRVESSSDPVQDPQQTALETLDRAVRSLPVYFRGFNLDNTAHYSYTPIQHQKPRIVHIVEDG